MSILYSLKHMSIACIQKLHGIAKGRSHHIIRTASQSLKILTGWNFLPTHKQLWDNCCRRAVNATVCYLKGHASDAMIGSLDGRHVLAG